MTISSWLNFGRPTPPGRGVRRANFLARPYYGGAPAFPTLAIETIGLGLGIAGVGITGVGIAVCTPLLQPARSVCVSSERFFFIYMRIHTKGSYESYTLYRPVCIYLAIVIMKRNRRLQTCTCSATPSVVCKHGWPWVPWPSQNISRYQRYTLIFCEALANTVQRLHCG